MTKQKTIGRIVHAVVTLFILGMFVFALTLSELVKIQVTTAALRGHWSPEFREIIPFLSSLLTYFLVLSLTIAIIGGARALLKQGKNEQQESIS